MANTQVTDIAKVGKQTSRRRTYRRTMQDKSWLTRKEKVTYTDSINIPDPRERYLQAQLGPKMEIKNLPDRE